jgi:hypothetical protein
LEALARNVPAIARHERWQLEQQLAAVAAPLNHCVGFRDGDPISSGLLVERFLSAGWTSEDFKDFPDWKGITVEHLNLALGEADARIGWAQKAAKAYCGWLFTQSDFLAEYEAFAARWHEQIEALGFPEFSPISEEIAGDAILPGRIASAVEDQFAMATKQFCIRWQLKRITGPYLPAPLLPQFPVLSSDLLTDTMRDNGVLIYLPRNFALMGEQELRQLLEDVIRGTPTAGHLRGWVEFASTRRKNKGQEFVRFGRLFELQHYWRVLYSRWETILDREKTDVMQAFADFFHKSLQQIKSDLTAVLSNRGKS